jgi:hypothetical protein
VKRLQGLVAAAMIVAGAWLLWSYPAALIAAGALLIADLLT